MITHNVSLKKVKTLIPIDIVTPLSCASVSIYLTLSATRPITWLIFLFRSSSALFKIDTSAYLDSLAALSPKTVRI